MKKLVLVLAACGGGGGTSSTDAGSDAGFEPITFVDDDHHQWSFDDEFWPDELGNYRVPISSRCERRLQRL